MDVLPSAEHEALIFPASFGQQRLWLLQQLQPGSTAYVMPLVLRLSGSLSVAALQHALSRLVERHEVLRTTFFETEGVLYQQVAEDQRVSLAISDVSEQPDPEGAARAQASALLAEPF